MNLFVQLKAQMRGTPSEALPENALIIDVRSAGEFAMGHVEGALNIPVESISPHNLASLQDKTQTLVVYCASGMRSGYARTMLMQMGYTNVINAGTPYETAQMTHKPLVR